MTTQNFLIGPIKEGLRKDVKPYATPEDSFETLVNAYQWRGRIVRRSGYKLLGTLANGTPVMGLRTRELFTAGKQELIAFDTTQAYHLSGGSFVVLPSAMSVVWSGTNSQFFFTTNYAEAFWATNSKPGLNGFTISSFTGGPATSINVTTTLANNFQVNDIVYFINVTGGGSANNLRQGIVTVAGNPFTVQETDGLGNFSNGNPSTGMVLSTTRAVPGQDGIRYYATTNIGDTWVNYNPPLNTTTVLAGALLIFPYRGYLVFLNTSEGNDKGIFNFGNRARWTQIGTPYYSQPVPTFPAPETSDFNAARDDIFGRGGANDAPTNEVIIGADFIRDILIVYFERSTWRLRFVNNSQNPFVWERVNIELGGSSTFSTIPFDKGLMCISNRGIVISDGNDTVRFDEKIPDDIFKIRQNNQGLQRVYGIRTFRTRLLYWTFPSDTNPNGIYPDQVLVFNYETKNWSYFDDSFTCFGYFYPTTGAGLTWNDLTDPWESYNISWDSGIFQSGYETVVAGNQQGFVFELEQDASTNDPSLSISGIVGAIVTSNNHNLKDGDWVTLSGVTGTTYSDGVSLNGRNFKISYLTANTFELNEFKAIEAGNALGVSFTYDIAYAPIIPGSVQINVGALVFTDKDLDGILFSTGANSGSINYSTGALSLVFSPAIGSTAVSIRVVSLNLPISPISTLGAYTGGGQIAKISNFDLQTKIFNFFNDDKRFRLSKIDFYSTQTQNGQFVCNVFSDSSDNIVNKPISDNPQSNVVLTSVNPYQFGTGDETIYRLYCDAIAQTIQLQLTMEDWQMAVNAINASDFELISMIISLRKGGRLV